MGNKLINLLLVPILIFIISSCSFEKSGTPTTPIPLEGSYIPHSPTPANGATSQFLYVTLKWECDSAIEYDIYLEETNPPYIKYVTTTNKNYTTPILKTNTRYYWQVYAKLIDGATTKSPIWYFNTGPSSSVSVNGYAMTLIKIETITPHTVKTIFQVADLNGSGVNTLKSNDFEVFEDYQPLSKTESEWSVNNYPMVYNQIRTVLMLDNSTSISSDTSKIKSAARTIAKGIRPNQEIAIYQFSDKVYLLQDFTNDANLLVNAINTKYSPGVKSTDFYGAFVFGTSLWTDKFSFDEYIQGCMIIISDGNDTQGSNTLANAMTSVNDKLVFTIGLGNEIQPEILKKLGTGGNYTIGQESVIVTRFKDFQTMLVNLAKSYYELSYKSPKRGLFDHALQIRILNNPYTGDKSTIFATFSSASFF